MAFQIAVTYLAIIRKIPTSFSLFLIFRDGAAG